MSNAQRIWLLILALIAMVGGVALDFFGMINEIDIAIVVGLAMVTLAWIGVFWILPTIEIHD